MKVRNFDIIVVGSGPSGSSFARTLSELSPDLSILMVECGPPVSTPLGRHVRRTADDAAREAAQVASQGPVRSKLGLPPARVISPDEAGWLPVGIRPGTFLLSDGMTTSDNVGLPAASMASNVGGMGAHWSCACPSPGPGELIPFIPAEEWKASFEQSYRLLNVTQSAFDGSELAAAVRGALGARFDELLPPGRRVQAMPLSLSPDAEGRLGLSGTDSILRDLLSENTDRFELRTNTLATRLIRRGGRVVGVRLRNLANGSESDEFSGLVFVAADSFRTPQLLHASGIRPAALGRYLNDHPDVRSFVQLADGFRTLACGESEAEFGGLARNGGVTWIPYEPETFPFSVQVMQLDASPIALDESSAPWPGSYVGIVVFGCKDLSPEDRVEFSEEECDPYGMPAMRIHYRLNARDHETYARMVGISEEIASALGNFVGGGPAALQPGGSYHFMGTVRMGEEDDGASVCDRFGAVWGVDNLWLGGNGLIPTATACNPTATNVALAVRSARKVLSDR